MKITVLTDNFAGSGFLAEHGLSFLVESEGNRVLFDTGSTDVFIRNANQLGMDLNTMIDVVVLSHGHWDHGNGLRYLKDKSLFLHPGALINRYRKNDRSPVGLGESEEQLSKRFTLRKTKLPVQVSGNLTFLGEIPRITNFESTSTSFVEEKGHADFLPDDSALVCAEKKKLFVISGCAHSGIVNIVLRAMKVTGLQNVEAVIGGFHLKHNNHQTKETVKYLKKLGVKKVYPSHCTQLPAIFAFSQVWEIDQLRTGMVLEL